MDAAKVKKGNKNWDTCGHWHFDSIDVELIYHLENKKLRSKVLKLQQFL